MPTINLIILSGTIGWVKIRYSTNQATYVDFMIKQPELRYENNKVVESSYIPYFVRCFDINAWSVNSLKEGAYATVQGKVKPFINKDGRTSITIVAEKIDIHGYVEEKEVNF